MSLVPVLNNKYPAAFFPAVPGGMIEILSVAFGVFAAVLGFKRGWDRIQQTSSAKALLRQAVESRRASETADPGEISQSGRIISRLVRNVDEDLKEVAPDFSLDSLKRLQSLLPLLLEEIQNKEDALIRLGVVGTYLGETACRTLGWQWFFKMDPDLRQFSYLASVLRKDGQEADPYSLACDWMTGSKKLGEVIERVR